MHYDGLGKDTKGHRNNKLRSLTQRFHQSLSYDSTRIRLIWLILLSNKWIALFLSD